jgi:membrane-associated phospholipid phosphatase
MPLLLIVPLVFLLFSGALSAQNADIRCLRHLNKTARPGLDKTMRVVSSSVAPLAFAVPLGILGYNLTHRTPGSQQAVPFVIAGANVSASLIGLGLKYAVNRERPYVAYDDIERRTECGPYSFPSSHTANAFALATALAFSYPKWYVIAPSLTWAVVVGYSRMRLGVHFPSDVLAGALVGAACGYGSYWLGKRYGVQ